MYHINLSIFRSTPDVWNIGQVFPVLPIHRLNERPCVPAVLADLTCDSYGKIDKFSGCPWPGSDSLALHEVRGGQGPYYLGLFLAGAYQVRQHSDGLNCNNGQPAAHSARQHQHIQRVCEATADVSW